LLPSGPGGVHDFTLRGDRHESPLFVGVIQDEDCPSLRSINQEKTRNFYQFFRNGLAFNC
jgi:hypothetical protein